MSPPSRGESWLADLDSTRGHEQAGRRPILIVSEDGLTIAKLPDAATCPQLDRNRLF